ncbi:hypothetical protein [Conexibacter sp. SYSU D00693]|uniref:hypothetical protein n=1 Tax=Conexibacter sp. SYSU D00693 TaxID=2812560 RepID=UPI00196B344E|nr:hypothetical protein [Conexibacter sp. SYSU D00693]
MSQVVPVIDDRIAVDVERASGGHVRLHPQETRMLRLLHLCGPQAALDLAGDAPVTVVAGLPPSVVTAVGREAGCVPICDAPAHLDRLAARGLVRLSRRALDPGRYLVLEDEHGHEGARRCSVQLTAAGRAFCTAGAGTATEASVLRA